MPINRALYPDDWPDISRRIRFERAGGKCERCGVAHGAVGARDANGQWRDQAEIGRWRRPHWRICIRRR